MGRIRVLFVFIVLFFMYGLHAKKSKPVSISAGSVSHYLNGISESAIEKTESWLNNDGILITVIKLKPQALRNNEPAQVVAQEESEVLLDYIPATMQKNVIQDRFWNALRERLSIDKTAQVNLTQKSHVLVVQGNPMADSQPAFSTDSVEPQLPTDAVGPRLPAEKSDDILSPQEREELETFNQSLLPQSGMQPMSQASVMSYPTQDHAMTLAMQMQMSARALSNQATALMNNAPRSYMPVNYQQMPSLQVAGAQPMLQQSNSAYALVSPALPRQGKMSRLMGILNQVMFSGVYSMQRLLVLVDLEVDIVERLLAGETGSRLERLVEERNKTLIQSDPRIVSCYDIIVDLATTDAHGEADSRLYHYFVRSGKKVKITQNSKKKFLLAMMYAMKHYREMIESMYNISRTGLSSR